MYSTSDYNGAYAQVKETLGEFWQEFDIDEIVSRVYEFDGKGYVKAIDDEDYWDICAFCEK